MPKKNKKREDAEAVVGALPLAELGLIDHDRPKKKKKNKAKREGAESESSLSSPLELTSNDHSKPKKKKKNKNKGEGAEAVTSLAPLPELEPIAHNYPLNTTGNVEAKVIHEPVISEILRERAYPWAEQMKEDGVMRRLATQVARRGGEMSFHLVAAGILDGDASLIDKGMRGNETGSADFDDKGVHSFSNNRPDLLVKRSTIFLQGVVRSVMAILGTEGLAPSFRERCIRLVPKMNAIARRLAEPENVKMIPDIAPNRGFLAAATFHEVGSLYGDEGLMAIARQVMDHTLTLQDDEGIYPEQGGGDTAYHSLSVLFLCRYMAMVTDPAYRAHLQASGQRAVNWLISKVDPQTGDVDVRHNTRVGPGGSKFRKSGRASHALGALYVPSHLVYFAYLTGQQEKYYPIAAKMAARNKVLLAAPPEYDHYGL